MKRFIRKLRWRWARKSITPSNKTGFKLALGMLRTKPQSVLS